MVTLAHVIEHPNKSDTQILLHVKMCPLMGPLQNIAMRETQMIVQAHLPKISLFYLPFIHVIGKDIVVHEFKMLVPIILHTIPIMPLKVCNPPSLNLLQGTTWLVIEFSSHPKQVLIFLFNTGRLLKFPFTII